MARVRLGGNYHRLWSASALSNLADGVFQIALPLLALRLTRSPGLVAGLALAGRLPWLLFALPAGALADRLDRRLTMIRVSAGRAGLIGSLAVLVAFEHEQLWLLYVVAFALGIGETLFDTAAQSIMPMVVDRDHLSHANGRLYAVELTMNQFVGPPLGGLLAASAMAVALGGSAGCYLGAAVCLLAVRGRFRPDRGGGVPPRLRTDIAEGLRYLWRHRLLRTLGIMVGVMNLANTAAFSVFPLFAVDPGPMGLSEGSFGVLLTTLAVGSLAGSWVAPRLERWLGRGRTLAMSVLGSALLSAGVLLEHPALVGIAFALSGVAVVVWNVITVSLRQRIVPDHLLGRVNAGYRLLAWGTMPIGAAVGGVVGEAFGLRAVFVLGAVASVLTVAGARVVTDEAIAEAEAAASGTQPVPA